MTRTQIDRLGDRLRKGKEGESDLELLDQYRRSFRPSYDRVLEAVRAVSSVEATGRPAKSTAAIIDKLRRETIRLSQIQDIAGCRLIVPKVPEQDLLVSRLEQVLDDSVVIDRRRTPSHGYRAVHIVATAFGRPVEVQIRTWTQHLWAEFSEKAADLEGIDVKYGGGPEYIRKVLIKASKVVGMIDDFESRQIELQAQLGNKSAARILAKNEEFRRELADTVTALAEAIRVKGR